MERLLASFLDNLLGAALALPVLLFFARRFLAAYDEKLTGLGGTCRDLAGRLDALDARMSERHPTRAELMETNRRLHEIDLKLDRLLYTLLPGTRPDH